MDNVNPIAWIMLALAYKIAQSAVPALAAALTCALTLRNVSLLRGLLATVIAIISGIIISFALDIPIDLAWYNPRDLPLPVTIWPWYEAPRWGAAVIATGICCYWQRRAENTIRKGPGNQ